MPRKSLLVWLLAASSLAGGDLTMRYKLVLDRVLSGGPPRYDDALVLADLIPKPVRRFTEYSGDVSGRYLSALSAADRMAPLDTLLPRMVSLQKPDGHFGDPMSEAGIRDGEMAMLWGNGRLLIGLMEYHQRSRRPEVLAAARRLGDFLVKVAPTLSQESVRKQWSGDQLAVGYICWTQQIEGLAALYGATRDVRYLRVAEGIAALTTRHPNQHSHGFLTSVRGIVDLYKLTHEQKYLDQAEKEWQGIIDSGNLLPQGAVPEALRPNLKRDEGCSEADWLRLSLALWQITGKPEYLENAELTLFNEYALNQFSTGDFGHRAFWERGISQDGARAWWCCTLHGLRGYRDVMDAVFRVRGEALYYDLPVDGSASSGPLRAAAESSLGQDGVIRLEITAADGRERALYVRRPRWVSAIEVLVNRTAAAPEGDSAYLRIDRAWQKGDRVELRYKLRTRAVHPDPKDPAFVLFHGPWMLGVDERRSPDFYNEPNTLNALVLDRTEGDIALETAGGEIGTFTVPAARFRVRYLPGGYSLQPDAALLTPIAEQTGFPSTAWTMRFRAAR